MPENQPEKEPATMQSMVARIVSARPNTIIGGSIGDGGGRPIGDGENTLAGNEPPKPS